MTAPDDPKCATADCGHPASAHGATPKMGANDGACTEPDCTCKAFTPPAAAPKKLAAPEDTTCATPDCGHPMTAHSDTKMAANDGACTMLDCSCEAFTSPVVAPTPTKGAPAAPGKGLPTAPPAPGKASVNGGANAPIKNQATLQEEADAAVDAALAAVAAVRAARLAAPVAPAEPVLAPSGAGDLPSAPAEVEGGADAQPFNMPIMVLEGVDTGDGRYIRPGALTWRDLPLVVMALTKTTMGHDEAELVARIDTIERVDASALINAKTGEPYGNTPTDGPVQALQCSGVFTSQVEAEKIIELVRDKFLRGVSADISDVKAEIEMLDDDGNLLPEDEQADDEDGDILDILFGDPGNMRESIVEGRIMGATICPFPAFEGAYIEIPSGDEIISTPMVGDVEASAPSRASITSHDRYGQRECAKCEEGDALVASAGPLNPPRNWFENPRFAETTPMTIDADGRIFGHMATWRGCHTGSAPGTCVKAPKSRSGYSYFRTGAVETFEGELVPVGQITMDTGHADLTLGANATLAHYDNTGTAVADIACGEDAFGVWFAGAMRPDVTPLQVRKLRASGISPDWRRNGIGMELMAALAVNVQGFPIVRAMVASGAMSALVAAGGMDVIRSATSSHDKLQELLRWKQSVEPLLLDAQADRFRSRVHRS